MNVRAVIPTALLASVLLATAAAPGKAPAAVPEGVRHLPWRREVRLPATPPAADTWYVVELDSLLAAVTRGDLGAVRLVDAAGEPVPAVRLEPQWPEVFAEPVAVADSAWQAVPGDTPRYSLEITLPPGDWLRARWSPTAVNVVMVEGADPESDPLPEARSAYRNVETAPAPAGLRSEAWRTTTPRLRLTALLAAAGTRPDVRLERLSIRADRVRSLPFRALPGTFHGGAWQQLVELPSGPAAVLSVRVDRRPDTALEPVTIDCERESGGWERAPAAARETASLAGLGFAPRPINARRLRLGYAHADPPNAPVTVLSVEAVPAALAIPPSTRGPLWLAYGALPMPGPSGLARDELRAVRRLEAVPLGPPETSPWFAEKAFGATWLRRRPLVLTAAMALVLGMVAAVVLADRGRGVN